MVKFFSVFIALFLTKIFAFQYDGELANHTMKIFGSKFINFTLPL